MTGTTLSTPGRADTSAVGRKLLDDLRTLSQEHGVRLTRCVVVAPDGGETPFAIDTLRREALLDGLDDIALTMKRAGEIGRCQAGDRAKRPWIYAVEGLR
jgi:3-isopropylmalate dehydratase small subunit